MASENTKDTGFTCLVLERVSRVTEERHVQKRTHKRLPTSYCKRKSCLPWLEIKVGDKSNTETPTMLQGAIPPPGNRGSLFWSWNTTCPPPQSSCSCLQSYTGTALPTQAETQAPTPEREQCKWCLSFFPLDHCPPPTSLCFSFSGDKMSLCSPLSNSETHYVP